jgi:hypothetical protein
MKLKILFAVTLAASAAGGCAQPPTFRSVLADRYRGYDQVLPTATVNPAQQGFDYLPGNVAVFALVEPRTPREAAVWSNQGLYCPVNVPLSEFRPRKMAPTRVVYDFNFSLRRALHLAKAKSDLRLEDNEIEFLRKVEIEISSPRVYVMQRRSNQSLDQACVVALQSREGVRKINRILVGDVRMNLSFKDNVSIVTRALIVTKLHGSLGFGYARGQSYDLSGENVVFGARLVPLASRKPQ